MYEFPVAVYGPWKIGSRSMCFRIEIVAPASYGLGYDYAHDGKIHPVEYLLLPLDEAKYTDCESSYQSSVYGKSAFPEV